jgi:hypothetical protein
MKFESLIRSNPADSIAHLLEPMRIFLFLTVFLGASLHAAETSARTLRILFLSGPADAPEKLHLFDGVSSQEVELTRMGFSPVYKIMGGDINIALLPKPPPATPEPGATSVVPAGAPIAAVSAEIKDFYLIVSSDPSNQVAPVRMQVINANPDKFMPGHQLWFNLTDCRIGGIVGTRKLVIEPNARIILDPPATQAEDYHVNIQFVPPGEDRAEPLCETNWTHQPKSRNVYFVVKAPGTVIPRIMGFPDFRIEEKDTKKP